MGPGLDLVRSGDVGGILCRHVDITPWTLLAAHSAAFRVTPCRESSALREPPVGASSGYQGDRFALATALGIFFGIFRDRFAHCLIKIRSTTTQHTNRRPMRPKTMIFLMKDLV